MLVAYIMALFATTTPTTQILPPQPIFPIVEEAKAAEIPIVATSSMSIQGKISYYAEQYKVSSSTMYHIVDCESGFDPTIQSHYTYKYDRPDLGVKADDQEQSFGLVQWHIPAGNKKQDGSLITKEDALNPDIALETLAWYLSQNKGSLWTCYNQLYGKKV